MKLENLKIGREVGRGAYGVVYAATYNKKKYAVKVEKICQDDESAGLAVSVWRELEFSQTMSGLYPHHFMKCYGHHFSDCGGDKLWDDMKIPLTQIEAKHRPHFRALYKSKLCTTKIYPFIPSTLTQFLLSNHSSKKYYTVLIQVVYVAHLMAKNGYVHCDFTARNIGLMPTKAKTINILGHAVPTSGLHVVMLDYGLILHKKYVLTKDERERLKFGDIRSLFCWITFNYDNFRKAYEKHLRGVSFADPVKISVADRKLLACYTSEEWATQLIYKLMYYVKYQKGLLGTKFAGAVRPTLHIPINTILYIIANIERLDLILKYMIDNI
jgi:serine/threonine protein kinase